MTTSFPAALVEFNRWDLIFLLDKMGRNKQESWREKRLKKEHFPWDRLQLVFFFFSISFLQWSLQNVMSMRDYNLHAVVCHLTKMQRVVPPPVLQRNSRFPSRHDVWCTWFFSPGGFSHCSCFRMQEETPAGHLNESLLFTGSCVNLPHLWWLVFVPESSSTVDLQLPTLKFLILLSIYYSELELACLHEVAQLK